MSSALIIFAKAPLAGLAKTRLIPALGPEGAAQLAQRLLTHTVQQALAAPVQQLQLCVTPSLEHPVFAQARDAAAGRLQLTRQGPGDLGQRMHRALRRALRTHRRVVLIGTDAPALGPALLAQAFAALDDHAAVFVPAHDGGYALVGLRHPAPRLFAGMAWSTPRVMQDTRDRALRAHLTWAELPAVHDIDEPADLPHLPPGWL